MQEGPTDRVVDETRKTATILTRMKKSNLPSKVCVACARPFVWRKKWERDWDRVLYCSDACRRGVHPLARRAWNGLR